MKNLTMMVVFLAFTASQAFAYDIVITIPDNKLDEVVALYIESNPNMSCSKVDQPGDCIEKRTDLEHMEYSIKKDFKGSIKHGKRMLQKRTPAQSIDGLGIE